MWRTQWTRLFLFLAPNLFPHLILLSEWGDHFTYPSPLLFLLSSLPSLSEWVITLAIFSTWLLPEHLFS